MTALRPATSRYQLDRLVDWFFVPSLLALAAAMVHYGSLFFASDWIVLSSQPQFMRWAEGIDPMRDGEWERVRQHYDKALQISPDNPALLADMGALHLLLAREYEPDTEEGQELYEQAAIYQVQALNLRPTHGWTWAGLTEAMQALQPGGDDVWLAWHQAQRYAPYELLVQGALYNVAQQNGPQAPADVQQWLRQTESTAPDRLRRLVGLPLKPVRVK